MGRRLDKIYNVFKRGPKRLRPGEAFSDAEINKALGIPTGNAISPDRMDKLNKAMAMAGIRKGDSSVFLDQQYVPARRDVFQQASNWENVRQDQLSIVIDNDSYLLNVFRILPNEIFKGKIRWEPAYGCKCPICNFESDKEEEECPDCLEKLDELQEKMTSIPQEDMPMAADGGTAIAEEPILNADVEINIEDDESTDQLTDVEYDPQAEADYNELKAKMEANPLMVPDQGIKKQWQESFKSCNCFGHSFEKVWRLYDRQIHKFDNGAMLAWKKHEFGELKVQEGGHTGKEHIRATVPIEAENKFTRIDSSNVEYNLDEQGYIAEQYFCVKHRANAINKEDTKYTGYCQEVDPDTKEKCFRQQLRAYYKVKGDKGAYAYYTNKEIMHNSYYNPTDTKGISPAWSIQPLLEAKFGANMELKLRFADKQVPPYILALVGSNEDAMAKQISKFEMQAKLGLPYFMSVEVKPGTTITDPIKKIPLTEDSVTDLVNVDMRKEILREVLALWGCTPIYSADMRDVGGLNAETMQLKVLASTTLSNQEHYHETEFPWVIECIDVEGWNLKLNEPQAEDSIDKERVRAARIDNAEKYRQMGLTIVLEDPKEAEFTVSGDIKEVKEQPSFGGFDDFGGGGQEDNNDLEMSKSFEMDSYVDMGINLSDDINSEIVKGLNANAGFTHILKNVEDLPQWSEFVQDMNPVLDKDNAMNKERYRLERIIRNESTKVRKEQYVGKMHERDPENRFLYRWAGPPLGDKRLSKQCKGILKMVAERGGAVTLPELENIMEKSIDDLISRGKLKPEAKRTLDKGSHQPHIGCRHRAIRVR